MRRLSQYIVAFVVFTLLSSYPLFAWTLENENFNIYTQTGFEFDSNVLKTFDQNESDFLARILLHADGLMFSSEKTNVRLKYNGGGKKFFENDEQDMLIQSLKIPISFKLNPKHHLTTQTSLKYQNESNKSDSNNLDVNEDYYSFNQLLAWNIQPSTGHQLKLSGEFGYFHFVPRDSFSFFAQRVSLEYRYQLKSRIWVSSEYDLSLQQFKASDRSDVEHEVSAGLHAFIIPYLSLKYQFEVNRSSVDLYDSTNHRITLLVSHLFGKNNQSKGSSPLSIHFLTTLQIRNFPSVTAVTQEGERFLLTGAEDQNFNHVTLKLSYHPKTTWALETKYSRFSNELSSQDVKFSRNLFYMGFRYTI